MTVNASGGTGPIEGSATADLIVDSTPPLVSAPDVRFVEGSTPGTDSIPLRLTWSGSDASGTQQYEIGRIVEGGIWTTIGSGGPGTTAATSYGEPNFSYRFRVRARDLAGNETTAAGPFVKLRRRPETAPSIDYSAGWTTQSAGGAYGGWLRQASAPGADAALTFTGRAFAWLSPVGPLRGSAEVYVDGVLARTVELRSAAGGNSRVVFAIDWPVSTLHTVRIRVVDSPGSDRVDIDELYTLR
ncbi:MAG: fibronectin type III domain-containing protein [Chloroflexi bacterium]|nr:fibronectin type III domain-containing protein [Chloroflexota bacterium]